MFQRSKPLKQFLQQLHSTILQELHNKFLTVDASTISQQSSPRESHNSPTKGSIVPKSLTESPKKKKNSKTASSKISQQIPQNLLHKTYATNNNSATTTQIFASHNPQLLHQKTSQWVYRNFHNKLIKTSQRLLKEKSHNIFITVEKSTANLPKPLPTLNPYKSSQWLLQKIQGAKYC